MEADSGALGQSDDSFRGPQSRSLWQGRFHLKAPGDPGFFHLCHHAWPSHVRPILQPQRWLFLFPAVLSQHPMLRVGREAESEGSRSPKGKSGQGGGTPEAVSLSQDPLPRVLA